MADARLKISFAGPLVTFQDAGRFGHLRYGVPASGPMDRISHAAAHAALGRPTTGTALEISLGGLMLECSSGAVSVAITGGQFSVEHAFTKQSSWTVLSLEQGDKLAVRAGPAGSWAYLAFLGDLDCESWLGQSSTHAQSGFGGGQLMSGQTLTVRSAGIDEAREGAIPRPEAREMTPIRVVLGPQDQHFPKASLDTFVSQEFTLSKNYDRMGMRLDGPSLAMEAALSIPSEPIVRGSVQVSGDGVPTVLLADHQTTGGYPKIATVIGPDIDRLVQHRAGDPVGFEAITADQAIEIARKTSASQAKYLERIAVPRGTLSQRLMRENLISGVVVNSETQSDPGTQQKPPPKLRQ